ncbi:MAG: hypothetical protein R3A10_05750 [Caldilineaceae bacterium]
MAAGLATVGDPARGRPGPGVGRRGCGGHGGLIADGVDRMKTAAATCRWCW